MRNHVETVNEHMMLKIEKIQTSIIDIMSVSTSIAHTIKSISISILHTSSSTHKPHSNQSSATFIGDQSTHRLSRSRNSSLGSTISELDSSLTPTMMPSPSLSPRVRTGSTKKHKASVSFKPVEKKTPSIFEHFVSKMQTEQHETELQILHYFSKLLGSALLSAVTGSLSAFKASITPRQQHKSVSTNNCCSSDSNDPAPLSTILEFSTNITFVIPESRLIPDLKSIQSDVDKVCSSLCNILRKVLWWGGSHGGSPLYDRLSEDPNLKELFTFLSSSIIGMCLKV